MSYLLEIIHLLKINLCVSKNIFVVLNLMRTRITIAMRILTGLGLFGMKNSCSSIVTGCRK